jgi:hypothetical protein
MVVQYLNFSIEKSKPYSLVRLLMAWSRSSSGMACKALWCGGIYTTFLNRKHNALQQCHAPSSAGGVGRGTRKIPLIPAFSLKGEGASICVNTFTFK